MSNVKDKVFSIEGKGLKLDDASDLEPHIADLRSAEDVEEVRLLGNTLGVGACKLLGEVLSTKKTLKVGSLYRDCLHTETKLTPVADCKSGGHFHRTTPK
jgi:Ran GTPase-activating protein (RanGAP) involved in mRNA processing and transport